jgi:PKD repeat protein
MILFGVPLCLVFLLSPAYAALPESDHPYTDYFDYTWSYTLAGNADGINVTFDAQTRVEANYDFIYVMDANGSQIPGSPFTGGSLAGKTVTVLGSTVKIRLLTDSEVTDWGFRVTNVDVAPITAQFEATPTSGLEPLEVGFTDKSVGGLNPIISWQWDFGDGSTSSEKNPIHLYRKSGVYTVKLTITTSSQEVSITKPDLVMVGRGDRVADQFVWPIAEQDFFILQGFGNLRMEQGGYHAATDFGVYALDVPVRSIANGWVQSFEGFGNAIMIKHILPSGEIVYSWYNHLAFSVEAQFTVGQFLPIGTVIGIVGETGWAPSGVHLHLEIKKVPDMSGGYWYDLSNHYDPYEFIVSRLSPSPDPPSQCADGTNLNTCSTEKPLHCIEGGYLVENSQVCGCETGVVQADGTCSKTESGIIIDNDDLEFQSSGNWIPTTEVEGHYGSNYLSAPAGSLNTTATWTPHIPVAGDYKVYGWWRGRLGIEPNTRATSAAVLINHAGVTDQVSADFSDYHKGWKYLGTFFFEQGNTNSVVVPGSTVGEVVADAFRFVPSSGPSVNADFTGNPRSGQAPMTVQFTDASTGDVTSWLWDFGDGGMSTVQDPLHRYSSNGIYAVTLTVTGSDGSDSQTKPNYVSVSPASAGTIAEFYGNPRSGEAPLTVEFTDASTGDVTSWLWDFGDGGTSTVRDPVHQYTSAGMYTVTLKVSGGSGIDTQVKANYVTVSVPPVAGFTASPTSGLAPLTVQFNDASTGYVTSWSWDFGDGGRSTASNPVHQYQNEGMYTVILTVTGDTGSGTLTRQEFIYVSANPVYDKIVDNGSPGFSTTGQWYSSTSVTGYYGADYIWAYSTAWQNLATAQWAFQIPSEGNYRVFAWWSAPYQTRAPDVPYTILYSSHDATVKVDQRTNGSRWNDLGIYHFSAGEVDVLMKNSVTSGNPVADAVRVVWVDSPVADFGATPPEGSAPLSVSFENHSYGVVGSFSWDFGDGESSVEENPIHEYSSPGNYTVTLEVSGPNGGDSETKVDFITVREPGAYDVVVDDDSTRFAMNGTWYTSTTVPGYYGTNYRWANAGDGATKAIWNFYLPSDGYYQVLAWWSSPYSTRSPNAPYTIYQADGPTTVRADQRSNGGQWNDLGTFYFMAGSTQVTLSNNAQNVPVADAVRIVEVSTPVQIIDNNSASGAFLTNGSWYLSTSVPGYYGKDYSWAYGGTGSATAEWILDVPVDGYYQVLAWWSAPYSSRSPNAPFTIAHAEGTSTVIVNQTVNGSRWNDLGVYYFLSGQAVVSLSNNCSGNPVADAVQLKFISE